LGFGAFADVHIGKLIGDSGIRRVRKDVISAGRFRDCDVAVKILRTPTGQTINEDFQQVSDNDLILTVHIFIGN
jgi:hypothetical protein